MAEMEYRRLGNSGLRVSALGFGSWVTFHHQLDQAGALECLEVALAAGVNFFDNAEAYAGGESERLMGQALRTIGVPRHEYVISTKLYWGILDSVNMKHTLNRKYLRQGIDASLDRLGLDFVDLVFCHRNDPDTPIEETVFTMHEMVASGKAHYWGTSEWAGSEIREAFEIADRHHLHKPLMEQPQYNVLHRERVEQEYASLYDDFELGLTIWSPLGSGLLTGKYVDGIPEGSRGAMPGYDWLAEQLTDAGTNAKVRALVDVASDIGCTPAQLAVAWCLANQRVSSVILGASRPEQLAETLAALDVLPLLDDAVLARIDAASS